MADIFHTFIINAANDRVFEVISTAGGLDSWWTKSSEGKPEMGYTYTLYFSPEYNWKAIVTKCEANQEFELQMTEADNDWYGTRVGFLLNASGDNGTEIEFYHTGWPENNEHYRVSCYCWAMYLRILKRYIEFGEQIRYENRLDV